MQWFLPAAERGNPDTIIDQANGIGYTRGNLARPLIHGNTYFAELLKCINATGEGDLVWFTDWQSNADERLSDDPDSALLAVLGAAISRGADVRALVWRSHSSLLGYSADEHRDLGEDLQKLGGDVLLDMRVRQNGAHHQKFVVIRHGVDPGRDIAFVGGIDLCHGRRDTAAHEGDPQVQEIAAEYGPRPPWHDVQVAIQGPAVHDVETVFRERWDDSCPTSRNPFRRLRDAMSKLDDERRPLPPQAPPPPAVEGGTHAVQLLRTYPRLGPGWKYDFARNGERSVARGYTRSIGMARKLIYLEDQFLWGAEMSSVLVQALERNPGLHLIAVLPQFPDEDGWFTRDPQTLGRIRGVLQVILTAPDRVAFFGLENQAGTPVYVHAKVCVLDDHWMSIGSDNFCRRSWTNDSELTAAIIDEVSDENGLARRLRLTLAAEHLDLSLDAAAACADPVEMFRRYGDSADALDAWHHSGQSGARPPGRLRRLPEPKLSIPRQLFAAPWYRYLHDPDGRALRMRMRKRF